MQPLNDTISTWIVLLVDDQSDNVNVARLALEYYHAKVYTATDGQEALDLLQDADPLPNLILMDLSMPVMDGWTALHRLRKLPGCAQVPVIALTAHAMSEDRERVMAAGFDGYIPKPIDVTTLVTLIQAELKAHTEQT